MKSNYEIFNASAGSGKTFTLTSRYLVKLLGSSESESYKRILALTFTNKASEEMKNRILSSLNEFSKFIPLKLKIDVNVNKEIIKIMIVKKYLFISLKSKLILENINLFIKIFFGLLKERI